MLKVYNNRIRITKGDSAHLTISIKNSDGTPYDVADTDQIRLQVRTSPNRGKLVFEGKLEVTENGVLWHIRPEDTNKVQPGTYYYDAQIENNKGDVYTFIPMSEFIISEEITL